MRTRQAKLWLDRSVQYPALHQMLKMVLTSPAPVQVQFILDPSLFDGITMLWEIHGQPILDHVYYLTRTYAYYLHRERLIMLGRWPGDHGRRQCPVSSASTLSLRLNMHTPTNNLIPIDYNNTGPISNHFLVPGSSVATASPADYTSTSLQHNQLTSPVSATGCNTSHYLAKPGSVVSVWSQQ